MNREIKFKFDWLLWFLILLPTFYVFGKDLRHIQMNFFQISVIMMLAVLHVNRYFGLFLGWAAFQILFFSDAPSKTVLLQNIFFAGVLYHFVVKYVVDMKRYFWVFFGLLAANVVWCALQAWQLDPIFHQAQMQHQTWFTEYSGFFALPAFLGNFAAIVLPLCVFLNPFLGLIAIPALLVSKSSFSLIAAGGGLLFFLWFRKRLVFWVALIVIVLSGSFYILKFDAPTGQFGRRLNVWGCVLKEGFKKQFFGHGIGSFGRKYLFIETTPDHKVRMTQNDTEIHLAVLDSALAFKKQPVIDYMVGKSTKDVELPKLKELAQASGMDFEAWDNCHNSFIQVFFEMGLFGVLILFAFIGNMFRRFLASKKDMELVALMSAFVAILIISFAHFPFYLARLGGPCIVLLALLETKLLRQEHE